MPLLEQVKIWVEQESPDGEAIAQTLDNLCYRLAGSVTPSAIAEIDAAISFLVSVHPEPKPQLVRPDALITAEPDTGPLVTFRDDAAPWVPALSADEKMDVFTKLKLSFRPH
tara:strand:+ start:953 stop:1288 length:336 start_codon:yes stop_codon:yes gene_type:complete